jgi:hypothetical protein
MRLHEVSMVQELVELKKEGGMGSTWLQTFDAFDESVKRPDSGFRWVG